MKSSAAAVLLFASLQWVAAGATPPATVGAQDWEKTLQTTVDGDWQPLAASPSAVVYLLFDDATRQGDIATARMRKEYRQDHAWMGYFPARSIVSRVEVDCRRRTLRDLASTGYAGNNLSGESHAWVADRPTLWSPVEAGTVGAMAVDEICARTRPARPD